MQLTDIPNKFNIPFASSAGGGFTRAIPQAPTGTPGQASLTTGFPPENFSPVAAGGVPPFGQDFNGLLNQVTAWNRWFQAGGAFNTYDPTFQAACGGYPNQAIVRSRNDAQLFYESIVDSNLTDPDAGGAGWIVWFHKQTAAISVYVNAGTGNDTNPGTIGSPWRTIGRAMQYAATFGPSQFTITINVSAGTYAEAVATTPYAGPNIAIIGAGNTTIVTGAANAHTFLCSGPNTMTVSSLLASANGGGSGPPCCFAASGSGANLATSNTTTNGAGAAGAAFLGTNAGVINVGTNTWNNSTYGIGLWASGGTVNMSPGTSHTFLTAVVCNTAFAYASLGAGLIFVPNPSAPTFTGFGLVTATKYNANLNGVIQTQGAGINYFPGGVAGVTSTGGQYA